jgi:hypothetical protein
MRFTRLFAMRRSTVLLRPNTTGPNVTLAARFRIQHNPQAGTHIKFGDREPRTSSGHSSDTEGRTLSLSKFDRFARRGIMRATNDGPHLRSGTSLLPVRYFAPD